MRLPVVPEKLKDKKEPELHGQVDIKSPIFRGGGRAFGPRPRSYGFKLE